MARFAQEHACLVWEVRPVFLEGRKVELRSKVLQVTGQRGRRRLGRAADLWVVVRLLNYVQRAVEIYTKVFSEGNMIR